MKRFVTVVAGVTTASISFSLASILIRYSLALGAEPIPLAAWRLLTASLLTLALLRFLKISSEISFKPSVLILTAIGGLLFGLHMSLWNISLSMTSVAVAATIVNSYPVVMVLADNVIFKTNIAFRQYLGLAVSLVAITALTITLDRGSEDPRGALLAFISMLGVAGYLIIGKLLRGSMSALEYTFYAYLIGGLVALMLSAVLFSNVFIPLETVPLVLLLVIFPTLLGHTIINALARITSLTVASIPPLLEPAGASLLAWALLGETISPFRILAVILAICGTALIVSVERKQEF